MNGNAMTKAHEQICKAVDAARSKAEQSSEQERSYNFGYVHGLERARGLLEMAVATMALTKK